MFREAEEAQEAQFILNLLLVGCHLRFQWARVAVVVKSMLIIQSMAERQHLCLVRHRWFLLVAAVVDMGIRVRLAVRDTTVVLVAALAATMVQVLPHFPVGLAPLIKGLTEAADTAISVGTGVVPVVSVIVMQSARELLIR